MTATRSGRADVLETHRMLREAHWTVGDRGERVDFDNLPRPTRGGGHLYLLEFDNGLSKVGRGVNPRGRVRDHAFSAWVWERRLVRGWVSDWLSEPEEAERHLITWAHAHGEQRGGSEWFRRLPFDETVQAAAARRESETVTTRAGAAERQDRLDRLNAHRRSDSASYVSGLSEEDLRAEVDEIFDWHRSRAQGA